MGEAAPGGVLLQSVLLVRMTSTAKPVMASTIRTVDRQREFEPQAEPSGSHIARSISEVVVVLVP